MPSLFVSTMMMKKKTPSLWPACENVHVELFVVSYRINHQTKKLVITGELDSSRWSNHYYIVPVVVVGGGGVFLIISNQIKSN